MCFHSVLLKKEFMSVPLYLELNYSLITTRGYYFNLLLLLGMGPPWSPILRPSLRNRTSDLPLYSHALTAGLGDLCWLWKCGGIKRVGYKTFKEICKINLFYWLFYIIFSDSSHSTLRNSRPVLLYRTLQVHSKLSSKNCYRLQSSQCSALVPILGCQMLQSSCLLYAILFR